MDEEKLRKAFQRIREDMDILKGEMLVLKGQISAISRGLSLLIEDSYSKITPADDACFPAESSPIPAHNPSFKPLSTHNSSFSTGNEGVPTDRQTNQQTDKYFQKTLKNSTNPINSAAEMLDSLDEVRKEIRLKFKRLTGQEFLVFSTLYQMGEEDPGLELSYKTLAERLSLTESSIRDYVGRLVKKGIPIEKARLNNKNISLSVSPSLRKVAPLSAILQLRDL
jgi:DNA-binding MarR family transcriptional regulator